VDWDRSCKPDLIADLARSLPFKSHSVDYIHSEDFIEQIDLEAAYSFFHEGFRILKEDGVMRVLTPDLYVFARRYLNRDEDLVGLWEREVGIPLRTGTLGELFNLGIRLLGHRFLYDEDTLIRVLRDCGFEPRKVGYQESDEKELRGLDIRSPRTGISLYFDCYKGKPGNHDRDSFVSRMKQQIKKLWRWQR
jgi:predicted SAM-dependent methyltransferase